MCELAGIDNGIVHISLLGSNEHEHGNFMDNAWTTQFPLRNIWLDFRVFSPTFGGL